MYFLTKDLQQKWLKTIKEAIGYSNIFDYYDVKQTIAKGTYGLVSLAINQKTKEKVAIKAIKKKDMKPSDIYQQRREIEILKMCHHINIIGLVDIFENCDYFYIVLEYMEGKDLFDYLSFRSFNITEKRAKHLTYQIAQGLSYMH